MDRERFDAVRDDLNVLCEDLLDAKGADYTDQHDRLYNFKEVARVLGLTPIQVWGVYFLKHVFAIQKLVRTDHLDSEGAESRFADARNYLDLGWALLSEKEGD